MDALSDHYLVCGFGRVGRQVVRDLRAAGAKYVVIDRNPESLEAAAATGIPYLEGEASGEQLLRQAGIERARALIACVDSDAENVFITLTARELRPDLTIVARASGEESEQKRKRAGAQRVVSPYRSSGSEMARFALHPQVAGVVDVAPEYRMEEIEVTPGCPGAGRPWPTSPGPRSSPRCASPTVGSCRNPREMRSCSPGTCSSQWARQARWTDWRRCSGRRSTRVPRGYSPAMSWPQRLRLGEGQESELLAPQFRSRGDDPQARASRANSRLVHPAPSSSRSRSAGSSQVGLSDRVFARQRCRGDRHFEQRRQRSRLALDPRRHERLAPVREKDDVTRLEVRRWMLEEAEVVACRVAEAVGRHASSVIGLPLGRSRKGRVRRR